MAEPLEDRRLLAITVDTLIDEADGSITDGDISLRDAIAAAPAGETIDFAAPLDGGTILLTQSQLAISRPLRIDASSLAGGLTLDVSASDPTPSVNNGDGSRLLSINDGNSSNLIDVELRGLTLTGADTNGHGGAILTEENLTIVDSTITDNAARFGGGIENTGILTILGSTISDNKANFGGGIRSRRMTSITDSTLSGNVATSQGGGIFNIGQMTIVDSTLSNNEASISGGGIINSGQLTITHSLVSENSARFGGGIRSGSSSTLWVLNSTLWANTAGDDGGGIESDGVMTLTNTVLIGNSADRGGGVDNLGLGTITNSSFSGNSANRGGGIRNANSPFTIGILEIHNSILWGDHATSAPSEIRDDNGLVTVNDSLVDGGWSGAGGNNMDVDPQFVDTDGMDDVPNTLDDDLRLSPTSPAIDAGNNLAPGLDGVATDRDGLARFVDDPDTLDTGSGAAPIIDLGAYEVQLPVPPLEWILNELNALQDDGAINQGNTNSLRVKIEHAITKFDQEKTTPGINMLSAFMNEVEAMVQTGKLTDGVGQALIDAAQEAIDIHNSRSHAQIGSSSEEAVTLLGDFTGDGLVNMGDVAQFIQSLVSPEVFMAAHPGVDIQQVGDLDGNGVFDFGDIGPLVGLFRGNTATAVASVSAASSASASVLASPSIVTAILNQADQRGRDKVFADSFDKRPSLDEPQLAEERQLREEFNATWDEALLSVL